MQDLTVTTFAPPSDHGGIGQYAEQLRTRVDDRVKVDHVPLYEGLGFIDYVRAALCTKNHDIAHIHFEYGFFRPKLLYIWLFFPLLYLYSKIHGVSIIVTVHEVWTRKKVGSIQYGYVWFVHMLLAFTATRLVFMTDGASADFRPHGIGDCEYIPHGVDTGAVKNIDPETARSAFGYEPDDIVIAQIGYVSPRKGTEDFLELASRYPEHEFLLAGGPLRKEDEPYFERVVEMAADNVHTTGVLSDEAFHSAFIATDVAVLAYHDIRQSGILNWCFAYGVPAVCRSISRFEELVEQGAPLVLFDTVNNRRLTIDQATDIALKEATERGTLMRNFGADRDLSCVAKQYVDLYQSVV